MDEILKIIAEPLGTLLLVLINAAVAMAVRWRMEPDKPLL